MRWPLKSETNVLRTPVLDVRRDRAVSPRTGVEHDLWVVTSRDYVNVVAFTADGRIPMVRQYRHGIRAVTLEIPGGIVDATDLASDDNSTHDNSDELSQARICAAAARELREETGYAAAEMTYLGFVHPNPAIMSNRCHTCLARNAYREGEMQLDPGEDIVVELLSPQELVACCQRGEVTHALVWAALGHAFGFIAPQ